MFQISSEETYQDGQIIFEEGSAGNLIYTIEDGAVELYKQVGAEKIVVDVLQPGDILGDLAYLAGIGRTVSARAVGATTVGIIDRSFLDKEYNRLSGSLRTILKTCNLKSPLKAQPTLDYAAKVPGYLKFLPSALKAKRASSRPFQKI